MHLSHIGEPRHSPTQIRGIAAVVEEPTTANQG